MAPGRLSRSRTVSSPSAATGIVVDAQLLVLLVVGLASPRYLRRHKRLTAYDGRDFDLVHRILAPSCCVIVTPHVLAEASNLMRQLGEPARSDILATLARLVSKLHERHVPATVAVAADGFIRLGLADAALLAMDAHDATLLTADTDLYLAASRAGRRVDNFHFIREAAR